MPQWAGSCWYYLRFIDPTNSGALVDKEKEQYWMPVDLYVGGAEHAVLHLLYARFWHKVGGLGTATSAAGALVALVHPPHLAASCQRHGSGEVITLRP